MAEIVNLRRARKSKARAEAAAQADANRAKHGVSKCERDLAKARAEMLDRDLAARKLNEKQ
ncbi:MAG TPA: DUF4169 family protein [Rhizomicrobium sp.]|jgi:hypothetical protein|nr:DUF4169 family protein [Rhizomicrobium sp.]